mgnify:CR=1 FL=1
MPAPGTHGAQSPPRPDPVVPQSPELDRKSATRRRSRGHLCQPESLSTGLRAIEEQAAALLEKVKQKAETEVDKRLGEGEQAKKLAYVSANNFTTIPAAELAAKLSDLTPGDLGRVGRPGRDERSVPLARSREEECRKREQDRDRGLRAEGFDISHKGRKSGDFHVIETDQPPVIAHACTQGGGAFVAVHNLSGKKLKCRIDLSGMNGEDMVDQLGEPDAIPLEPELTLDLERYGFRWYRLRCP